jgi:hypothetical protein
MTERTTGSGDRYLFGIGEWYGRLFANLAPEQRQQHARLQLLPKRERPSQLCPFRNAADTPLECTKEGGVCSLRLYIRDTTTGRVGVAPGEDGELCTTCPYRFYEDGVVFRWIGETVLGHPSPIIVREVGFLERDTGSSMADRDSAREEVGRIDHVLVHPDTARLSWCALEMQAVYFSGASMQVEFRNLAGPHGSRKGIPFPAGRRRPDYRSSGPKRLMPQLQIKVPTLRRWGRKICVLVDRGFYTALGKMEEVDDISNCDIVWLVVRYEEQAGRAALRQDSVHLTTLEHAVEGLTAGRPVSLATFEARIRAKLESPSASQPT